MLFLTETLTAFRSFLSDIGKTYRILDSSYRPESHRIAEVVHLEPGAHSFWGLERVYGVLSLVVRC